MTLLIDIGNSRTKYIAADALSTGLAKVVNNNSVNPSWLNKNFKSSKQLIVACVSSNALLKIIVEWAKKNSIAVKIIESEAERYGVVSIYHQPKKLGIDRWLAMIGAVSLHANKNILIVDAGTATTIDFLLADGKHQGGWILPGINLMFNSLLANTSKVSAEKEVAVSLDFGINTSTNVNNACWAATVGAINLAVIQADNQHKSIDLILLTGGNAKHLQRLLNDKTVMEEKLIFHGLQRYNLN